MITVTGKDYRDRERLQRQGKITETGKVTETWKRQGKFTKTGKDYIDRKGIQRKGMIIGKEEGQPQQFLVRGTFSSFFRSSHL